MSNSPKDQSPSGPDDLHSNSAESLSPQDQSLLDPEDVSEIVAILEQANRPDLVVKLQRHTNLAPSEPFLIYSPAESAPPEPPKPTAPPPPPPTALAIAQVGTSMLQKGQVAAAVDKLRYAIELDPNLAEAHANLGVALAQLGQFAEAERSSRTAAQLRPTGAAWGNVGNSCLRLGKNAEAEEAFRQAVLLEPKDAVNQRHLGLMLEGRSEFKGAEACFRAAAMHAPKQTDGHFHLGRLLDRLGRHAEAEACFEQAIKLRRSTSAFWSHLGHSLGAQNKHADAEHAYRVAIGLEPGNSEFHCNLGVCLGNQLRYREAEAAYRKALELSPNSPTAHHNLGNVLRPLDRYDDAIKHLNEALRLQPKYPEAFNTLGIVHAQLRRISDAKVYYEKSLALRPDYPEAHLNRSLLWLGEGDFERGWPEYEWRLKLPNRPQPKLPFPSWDGTPLNGRTLLLLAEQGLGDGVQFMRFAAEVPRGTGGRIVLDCPKELFALAQTCPGIDLVVRRGEGLPKCDVSIPLLSIPKLLGTNETNIPARIPYLSCDPKRIAHWRGKLSEFPGLRVGIAWQGSLDHREDRWRSIELRQFKTLVDAAKSHRVDVHLCSLQKGRGAEQINDGSAKELTIYDFGAQTGSSFADTAALMHSLDVVVTVDTSIAHVAGALGLPIWVMIPFASDWRWLTEREDSPWYPSMCLFRQTTRGDWEGVLARIGRELRTLSRR